MAQSVSRRVEARRPESPSAGISTSFPIVSIRRRNSFPSRLLGLMPKRAIRSGRSSRSATFSTVQGFVTLHLQAAHQADDVQLFS